jgi:hypothetical protein
MFILRGPKNMLFHLSNTTPEIAPLFVLGPERKAFLQSSNNIHYHLQTIFIIIIPFGIHL